MASLQLFFVTLYHIISKVFFSLTNFIYEQIWNTRYRGCIGIFGFRR